MAAQPELDAVDMHHGAVESWLQHNPGKQVSDLLSQFLSLGVKAFLFKATEGRTFKDPKFPDLVGAATGLGVTRIAAYHVNLRGDGGLSRVDEEIANLLQRTAGLPIGVCMVDWEVWEKRNDAGQLVPRPPDDPATGGTVEQTALLVSKLDQYFPGKVLLYAGLPMVARHLNEDRLLGLPLVYPDYRRSSAADPATAAANGGIRNAAARMVMHQWAGGNGVLGFDSNRVIEQARFDTIFGGGGGNGDNGNGTEDIVNQLPTINPGDRGDHVKRAQALLLAAGFSPGTLDGIYLTRPDSPTRGALVGFQASRNLPQDAVVTLTFWRALLGV